MYQFAYSAICEELPAASSAPLQSQRLPDAIELIEAADRVRSASPHVQLQLLSDFRRLWLSIANDLIQDGQDLSPESRANVRSDASRILEEIERRRFSGEAAARARPNTGAQTDMLL
jgi:flagellar biosynthesis regulator FlaF